MADNLFAVQQQTDELATLRERVRDLEEWNRKMVEMAASKNNLDGYRELGQRAAQAESIADTLRAENARLRNLLRETRGAWWRDTDLPRELFDDLPLVKQIRITLARTEAENG